MSNFLHGHVCTPIGNDHAHVIVDQKDWEEAHRQLSLLKKVTLSRRNLLYLLAQLEKGVNGPYIIKPNGTLVVAESDAIHYKDSQHRTYSDETQTVVDEIEDLLSLRRRIKANGLV